jgi:cytochrome b
LIQIKVRRDNDGILIAAVQEMKDDQQQNHPDNEPAGEHPRMGPAGAFRALGARRGLRRGVFERRRRSRRPDPLHVWGGYVVGAIVVLRVVWGFVGPRHARFRDFVRSPIVALAYFTDLLYGRARRYVGHSPAGGAMVIALLLCLAATVTAGLIAYGEEGKGPLAAVLVTDANANGDAEHRALAKTGGEQSESTIGELHGLLANITLALVVAHIFGVAVASVVHKENLVLAMITGRKRRARE